MEEVKGRVIERAKQDAGLGEDIEQLHDGGPYLGPRNQQEYDRLSKEIEDAGKDFT